MLSIFGIILHVETTTNRFPEYPAMRVFSFTPGIVKSEMLKPEFVPFAYDTGALAAGFTLYLANPRADYLRGGFSSANCTYHIWISLNYR